MENQKKLAQIGKRLDASVKRIGKANLEAYKATREAIEELSTLRVELKATQAEWRTKCVICGMPILWNEEVTEGVHTTCYKREKNAGDMENLDLKN